MTLRTPLARARGLGSAKEGMQHWWAQRLTAVALIPLSIWFVASLVTLATADYAAAVQWIQSPVAAVLLVILIVATFYHAVLGMQVVFEDYIHVGWLKVASLILLKFIMIALAFAAGYAVLQIALGG
jgi:succinate dehydrogenase / fumarate reductase membrane anchor subunit